MLRNNEQMNAAAKAFAEWPDVVTFNQQEWTLVSLAPYDKAWYYCPEADTFIESECWMLAAREGTWSKGYTEKRRPAIWPTELGGLTMCDDETTESMRQLPGDALDPGVWLDRVTLNAWKAEKKVIVARAKVRRGMIIDDDVTDESLESIVSAVDYGALVKAKQLAAGARARMDKVIDADLKQRGSQVYPVHQPALSPDLEMEMSHA